ncbi:MAG: hypothetical protein JSR39_00330 [Verrucomicrobia bacterium]|nr:hypothetical protein [Verrucomicrobiota bacterium]
MRMKSTLFHAAERHEKAIDQDMAYGQDIENRYPDLFSYFDLHIFSCPYFNYEIEKL